MNIREITKLAGAMGQAVSYDGLTYYMRYDNVMVMVANKFITAAKILDGTDRIAPCAFCNINLKVVDIPKSVTHIGTGAFSWCSKLKRVTIPEGVQILDNSVFYNCDSLEEVEIPKTVTGISSNTFYGCKNLQRCNLPNVKTIGWCAFMDCLSLTDVSFSSQLEEIRGGALDGCESLQKIEIPLSTNFIGTGAFHNCPNLRQVVLPRHLKQYIWDAFEGEIHWTWIE